MRLFSALQRHPEVGWFGLVAAVQPLGDAVPASHHVLSRPPLIQVFNDGELVLYPNNAVGQPNGPARCYRNNQGQIWVTVQRCEGGCACPAAPLTHGAAASI